MNIQLYRFLTLIFSPFFILFIYIRKIRNLEDKKRFKERFAITKAKRPDGKLIWINAVSIGEMKSSWPLIKKINEIKNYNILLTTTTITSSNIAKDLIEKLPNKKNIIHQFFPVDLSFVIKKFLKHWKPDIFINVESEFWPNTIIMTNKICPVISLNAKMSKKSFRRWTINKKIKQQMFDAVDLSLAQTPRDAKRFTMLGVRNVKYIGNIKFFSDPLEIDYNFLQILKDQIDDSRKKWLVNCTHEGEEEIIIKAHKLLKEKNPNLITLIILRHANRSAEVCKLLEENKIKYVTKSSNKEITNETEVYLFDILGKIGTLFEFVNIVFIAGSLKDKIGGHTPIEVARQARAIITGPYIENNKLLFKELLNNNACIILENNTPELLAKTVEDLFEHPEKVKELSNNAYLKTIESNNLLNQILVIIKEKIDN